MSKESMKIENKYFFKEPRFRFPFFTCSRKSDIFYSSQNQTKSRKKMIRRK